MTEFARPRALARGDRVGTFSCGVRPLDNWFRTLALRNQEAGASRTFVSIAADGSVAGYYSLSSFTVRKADAGELGAAMPDPVPATLIGRLAVDQRFRSVGLGASLLQDAVVRAVDVSLQVGSAAVVVHTRDAAAPPFSERFGFTRLPGDEHTLVLTMRDAAATIAAR